MLQIKNVGMHRKGYHYLLATLVRDLYMFKLAFHGADTDTDILARIVARISACHLHVACYRNNFRKSRMSDVLARILARMSVSVPVSAPWNSSFTDRVRRERKAIGGVCTSVCLSVYTPSFESIRRCFFVSGPWP